MLARLAENLFWAGRYVERAEDVTRMMDVTYHTLLEATTAEQPATWAQLLEVLRLRGAYGDRPLEPGEVISFLVLDRDNPGSVTSSIHLARENGRSVRELISSELWEALNDLHLALGSRDLRRDVTEQPYELFSFVRRSCLAIYGVASETMPRDEGWRFMALGRMLERAQMTGRLLAVRYGQLEELAGPSRRLPATAAGAEVEPPGGDRTDFHRWVAVLKSASAFEAYRRRYRDSTDPADVVEFLLLAPDLPRSILFCLTAGLRQLEALAEGQPSPAGRRLGRLVASLQYRDVSELFDLGLHDLLHRLEEGVSEVFDAIAAEFFRHEEGGTLQAVASA